MAKKIVKRSRKRRNALLNLDRKPNIINCHFGFLCQSGPHIGWGLSIGESYLEWQNQKYKVCK